MNSRESDIFSGGKPLFPRYVAFNDPDFRAKCFYLSQKYLHVDYSKFVSPRKVKRHFHGSVHAASCVLHLHALLNILQTLQLDFLPENFYDPNIQKLLAFAVFCHDIGNTKESDKNDERHAKIFTEEMRGFGFADDQIKIFANAMQNKDKDEKNIYQLLIHDVDCLDYIRLLVRPIQFNLSLLFLNRHLNKETALHMLNLLRIHLLKLFPRIKSIYQSEVVHDSIEHSQGIFTTLAWLYSCNTLDIYQLPVCAPSTQLNDVIIGNLQPFLNNFWNTLRAHKNSNQSSALQLYNNDWLLLRKVFSNANKTYGVEDEIKILKNNADLIKASEFTAEQSRFIGMKMPAHYRIRPGTVVSSKAKIRDFYPDAAGVLLDPKSAFVNQYHKRNVLSNNIHSAAYSTLRPQGVKGINDFNVFTNKILECEARRKGAMHDAYQSYYGLLYLENNEVWFTYCLRDVIGIVVSRNAMAAQNALEIAHAMWIESGKIPDFFYYSAYTGLEEISAEEVIYFAGLKTKNIYQSRSNNELAFIQKYQLCIGEKPPPFTRDERHPFTCLENLIPPALGRQYDYRTIEGKHARALMINDVPIIAIDNKRYLDDNSTYRNLRINEMSQLITDCNAFFNRASKYFQCKFNIKYLQLQLLKQTRDNKTKKHYLQLRFDMTCDHFDDEKLFIETSNLILKTIGCPAVKTELDYAYHPITDDAPVLNIYAVDVIFQIHKHLQTITNEIHTAYADANFGKLYQSDASISDTAAAHLITSISAETSSEVIYNLTLAHKFSALDNLLQGDKLSQLPKINDEYYLTPIIATLINYARTDLALRVLNHEWRDDVFIEDEFLFCDHLQDNLWHLVINSRDEALILKFVKHRIISHDENFRGQVPLSFLIASKENALLLKIIQAIPKAYLAKLFPWSLSAFDVKNLSGDVFSLLCRRIADSANDESYFYQGNCSNPGLQDCILRLLKETVNQKHEPVLEILWAYEFVYLDRVWPSTQETALHLAFSIGDLDLITELCRHQKIDLNARNSNGQSLFDIVNAYEGPHWPAVMLAVISAANFQDFSFNQNQLNILNEYIDTVINVGENPEPFAELHNLEMSIEVAYAARDWQKMHALTQHLKPSLHVTSEFLWAFHYYRLKAELKLHPQNIKRILKSFNETVKSMKTPLSFYQIQALNRLEHGILHMANNLVVNVNKPGFFQSSVAMEGNNPQAGAEEEKEESAAKKIKLSHTGYNR